MVSLHTCLSTFGELQHQGISPNFCVQQEAGVEQEVAGAAEVAGVDLGVEEADEGVIVGGSEGAVAVEASGAVPGVVAADEGVSRPWLLLYMRLLLSTVEKAGAFDLGNESYYKEKQIHCTLF